MKQKQFSLLLLASLMYVHAFAQPRIGSQKVFGGELGDELTSMYLTKDGGYILGGSSSSNKSGQKTENNRCGCDDVYSPDYWVIKLDSSGKIQWDKTIGGNDDDQFTSIQQTTDGGYILGGTSVSNKSGEKTENSRGFRDYWVIKLDSSGKIQWDKTIGGNDYDILSSLQQTGDGGYILGGESRSNKSGEKTENNRGGTDYWVVKLDRTGKIQWDKTIGGSSYDELPGMALTKDGGYILGGRSLSDKSGDKTENSRGFG